MKAKSFRLWLRWFGEWSEVSVETDIPWIKGTITVCLWRGTYYPMDCKLFTDEEAKRKAKLWIH